MQHSIQAKAHMSRASLTHVICVILITLCPEHPQRNPLQNGHVKLGHESLVFRNHTIHKPRRHPVIMSLHNQLARYSQTKGILGLSRMAVAIVCYFRLSPAPAHTGVSTFITAYPSPATVQRKPPQLEKQPCMQVTAGSHVNFEVHA